MKNIYFEVNGDKNNAEFSVIVDGRIITDGYSIEEEGVASLIHDLVYFGDIPLYRRMNEDEISNFFQF